MRCLSGYCSSKARYSAAGYSRPAAGLGERANGVATTDAYRLATVLYATTSKTGSGSAAAAGSCYRSRRSVSAPEVNICSCDACMRSNSATRRWLSACLTRLALASLHASRDCRKLARTGMACLSSASWLGS